MVHGHNLLCLNGVALDVLASRSLIDSLLIGLPVKFSLSNFCHPRVQSVFGTLQYVLAI